MVLLALGEGTPMPAGYEKLRPLYLLTACATALLLLTGMLLEKPAYGSTVYGDGEAAGGSFPALYHQAYHIPICEVDGATACTAPRRIVHLKVALSGSWGDWICGNVGSCGQGDNHTQWETRECYRSAIRLIGIIEFNAYGTPMQARMLGHIINGSASRNVDQGVGDTLFGQKPKADEILSLPCPLIQGKVNIGLSTNVVQDTSGHELPNHVISCQERAASVNKEASTIDLDPCIRLNTYNSADGLFHSVDGIDKEVITALGDGSIDGKTGGNDGPEDNPTTNNFSTNQVRPFSDRCKTTSQNGVWNVQCPAETEELHRVVLPPFMSK
jgi:hypothetical protein